MTVREEIIVGTHPTMNRGFRISSSVASAALGSNSRVPIKMRPAILGSRNPSKTLSAYIITAGGRGLAPYIGPRT